MFGKAYTIGSIRGIAIRIDVSWFLIALLVTWSFWARFSIDEERGTAVAVAMGVVGAALFFGSILAHELAHALEAEHRGVTVAGITLFVFGGVTESRFDVRRPVDEFALTAVGPFTSFVAAAVFGLIATGSAAADLDAVADVAGLLGWINVALGVFNLLPGAPLDGGRILRSAVWWVTKDRRRATRVAARSGQVLGALLIGIGVLQFFAVEGAPIGGIWLAIIGWFLLQAARAEITQAELESLLAGRDVGSLLPHGQDPISPGISVAEAVERYIAPREADTFLVEDDEGRVVGIVGIDEVRRVPRPQRPTVLVADVMRDVDGLPSMDAGAAADGALESLQSSGAVLVRRDGERPGVLTMSRLATYLQRSASLERGGVGAGR